MTVNSMDIKDDTVKKSALTCTWTVVDKIALLGAFPLNIQYCEASNFSACPFCLTESADIKQCVMLTCKHRYCLGCVSRITACVLCRAETIPEATRRITLCFDGMTHDMLWWQPSIEDMNEYLSFAAERLCNRLFGTMTTINSPHYGTTISQRYAGTVAKAIGSSILVKRGSTSIRGITLEWFNRLLPGIINNIFYSTCPNAYHRTTIEKFCVSRWPHLKVDDIDRVLSKLTRDQYLVCQDDIFRYLF